MRSNLASSNKAAKRSKTCVLHDTVRYGAQLCGNLTALK